MKKVVLVTLGSRGDVQPFISLAQGLIRAGYDAVICTSEDFKDLVTEQGVPCSPVRADYLKLASSDMGKKMMGGSLLTILKQMKSVVLPMIRHFLYDASSACKGAEMIIYHPKAFAGLDLGEAWNVPVLIASPTPVVEPVSLFPNPAFLPGKSMGRYLNRKSYGLNRLAILPFLSVLNKWRKEELGLSRRNPLASELQLRGQRIPVLYGISPAVLQHVPPEPHLCISGYWFMEEKSFEPDPELHQFLKGDQPICIGFGSMGIADNENMMQVIIDVVRKLSKKVIVLTGWSGMQQGNVIPNILFRRQIPHEWLFKRVSVVVHHGGAGTTAACLRAGVPMVVCPLMGDQAFWAKQSIRLGVSHDSIPLKQMTGEALASAIQRTITDPELLHQAKLISEKLTAEDGVGRAVEYISSYMHNRNE